MTHASRDPRANKVRDWRHNDRPDKEHNAAMTAHTPPTLTPLAFAQRLARSERFADRSLAIAIVARGLSDDDPATFRQGWPLVVAVEAAAQYLGLVADAVLLDDALKLAPTISDAMLNKGASAAVRP